MSEQFRLRRRERRDGHTPEPPSPPSPAEGGVRESVNERFVGLCELVPIDGQTWAIVGSIAYDGEVILAEFDNREDAEVAFEQATACETPQARRARARQ